jgi:penicillin-binding protein 1A
VHLAQAVGPDEVRRLARELGITTPIQLSPSAALGASEVRLVELASVYRAIASGVRAAPHVIDEVTGPSGEVLYRPSAGAIVLRSAGLREIQEGLRGVVRIPGGTANSLNRGDFPIPVMGKTGTTNSYRDALFIGSTYGLEGITVAVRVGFDDNRSMGSRETGGRAALPIFREIMTRAYGDGLVGPVPRFPPEVEASIDRSRLRDMRVTLRPLAVPRY